MKFLIFSAIVLVAATGIKSKELDPGPQTFTNSGVKGSPQTTKAQTTQKRYTTKEIIMYLTPTQIKALNQGNAFITSQPTAQLDSSGQSHEQEYLFNMKNLNQNEDINIKDINLIRTLKPVEEALKEDLLNPLPQKEYIKNSDVIDLVTQSPKKQQLFYPESERNKEFESLLTQQEKDMPLQSGPWIPFNPFAYNKPQSLYRRTLSRLNPILENNDANLQNFPLLQSFKHPNLALLNPVKTPDELGKGYGNLKTLPLLNPVKNVYELDNIPNIQGYFKTLPLFHPIKGFEQEKNQGNIKALPLLKSIKNLDELDSYKNLKHLTLLHPIKNIDQEFSYGYLKTLPSLHPIKSLDEQALQEMLRLPSKYAPLNENNKNVDNSEGSFVFINEHNLEREKALAEIVSIASSLPGIQNDVNFKKHLSEPNSKLVISPLPLLSKKNLNAKQSNPFTLPFFYSSLDLDKLPH